MLNNETEKNCGFADEIVSYIYGEIGEPERGKFENHLVDCMSCTDEFAGISNARFAMFEWQKEEFAHLETPEIVIPYAPKQRVVDKVGLLAGLTELLGFGGGWPSVAMAVGALAIVVGLGFVVMNYNSNRQQVAETGKPSIIEQKSAPVIAQNPESVAVPSVPQESNSSGAKLTSAKPSASSDIRPVRASMKVQRVRIGKNLTARQTESSQMKRNTPVLTAYDEEADSSLRLADLFDEGGL